MLTRIFIALILSAIGTVILFIGAAMMDGMCHCMTSMVILFPYGSFVMMHFSSDTWGWALMLIQFPVYVLVVMLVKRGRWRFRVVLFLILLHIAAASFALTDYCQRRTCFLRRQPTGASFERNDHHPVRGEMFIARATTPDSPPRQGVRCLYAGALRC